MKNKFFTYHNEDVPDISSRDDIVQFICKEHSIQPYQIKFERERMSDIYMICLYTKLNELFAVVGKTNIE